MKSRRYLSHHGGARISIIIPVLRETGINGLLDDLKEKLHPCTAQIIVVDGDGLGGTLSLVSDPDVIKLISPKGRGIQQNRGAGQADGQILVFLHADTRLPDHFYQMITDTIAAGYAGGAFDLEIDDAHPLIRIISKTASLRSRITGVPYGDQCLFITRSAFMKLGGFPEIPLMEDIAMMQKVKKARLPFKILGAKAVTSSRMWHKKGIVYTMIRNPVLAFLFLLGVPPRILVRFYYG